MGWARFNRWQTGMTVAALEPLMQLVEVEDAVTLAQHLAEWNRDSLWPPDSDSSLLHVCSACPTSGMLRRPSVRQ